MDNKNNRLFYWNVKDFLTNKSEEQQIKPKTTLKNSIEGILSENKIYRQNDFCDNNIVTEDVSRYLSRWAVEENKYDPKNISYSKNSVSNPFMLTENPMMGNVSQMSKRALGAQSSTIQASLNQPSQMDSNPMAGSANTGTQTNVGMQSSAVPTSQNAANIVSNIVSQAGQGAKSMGMKLSSNYDQYSDPRRMASSQGSGMSDQQAAASDTQRGAQRRKSGFDQNSVSTSTGNSGVADDRITVDTRTDSSMGNNQGLNVQSFNPKADDRITTGIEKDDSYFRQLSSNISAGGQNLGLNMNSGTNVRTSGNRRRGVMEGSLSGGQVTNKIFEAMVMVPGKGYVYMPDTSSGTQPTARPQPTAQPTTQARPQPTAQPTVQSTETAKATEVAKAAEAGKGAQGFKAGFVNQLGSELKGEIAGAKRLISPVTSPVQTAQNIGQGVQSVVKGTGNLVNKTVGAVTNPVQAAKDIATAKNIGKAVNVGKGILSLAGGLGVGEVVEKGVDYAMGAAGVPEGFGREMVKSGANWGGMAAGTAVAGELLAGGGGAAALGAGAAAAVPAAIAGAAVLPVAYGSYKAGQAIGGIEVNKKGETVSDKIGEFGYNYVPGVKSLANWSVDANKGVDTRLGENKPKSVAELQALSAKERGEATQEKFGGKSQSDIDAIRAKAAARRAGASDFEKQAMQAPQKLTAEQEAALESPMLKQARLEKEAALKKQQETESQVDPTGQLNRRR